MANAHSAQSVKPPLPPPPREPDWDECCGNGCNPCVFDLYEQRLERWRARCEQIRSQHGATDKDEKP
ncbi:MAG: oxidoreductase-like domain-containing protein [Spiribacter sp.]|jgi:cytochrome-b5 reductase|nr:oxidoreductase-like domain-containing protein [Spiribacter sp.]MDR9489425.1 oxidoreductase-like domain-containing protein [Spiribacter sp.]